MYSVRLIRLAMVLLLYCPPLAFADPAPYAGTNYVSLPVRVLLPDSTPAANTTITVCSMERSVIKGAVAGFPVTTVTDSAGSATLKYPTRVYLEESGRGWAIDSHFALVEPANGHAGAIVSLPMLPLEDSPLDIRIARGYTLRGQIVTQDGHPVTSHTIGASYDLHAQTHTGHGGEIWERETVTDAHGNFTFTNVNPSPVTLKPDYTPNYYWAKTTVNGESIADRIDEFQPEWNNTQNDLTIHLATMPAKTYRGIALDQDGKPVAGASVTIGYSWHREEKDWSDSHAWETTTTGADGSWQLDIPTEWVTWGEVRRPGKPGPQAGTAYIAATGDIDLDDTTTQAVHLQPTDETNLMPSSP